VLGLSLVAAACGGDDDDDATDATEAPSEATDAPTDGTEAPTEETEAPTEETEAPTEETEGTTEGTEAPGAADDCGFAPSDVTDGAISGFAGTTPFGELTEEFFARLCEVDPNLEDLNYGAETYDAVMIAALATAVAGDDGIAHASEINGVTRDGEKCTTYADCLALIEAGTDIDYDGASGPLTFAGNGEPTEGTYGLLTMGDNNRIDPTLTEYLPFSAPPELDVPEVPVEGTRQGDGVLTIGTILPQTGSLAFLGPPEFAGFDVAIAEINDAGGVLGQQVVGIKGDSGDTTTNQAEQTVDRLLSENVDVIIGAASSGVSLSVIDKITSAGVTQISPANTSTELSDYADKGLYFRTAPPDIYQGDIIGQFIVNDGHQAIAMIHLNDSYGNSLADAAHPAHDGREGHRPR
jgi:ABC-type branched-subunit amino acid transport system substrate-binding protein